VRVFDRDDRGKPEMTTRLALTLVGILLLASCVSISDSEDGDSAADGAPVNVTDEAPTVKPPDAPPRTPAERKRPSGAAPLRFSVGHQPKQVAFTPDGEALIVPLLDDDGIDLIRLANGSVERVRPDIGSEHEGFVEVLVDTGEHRFLVSQMTTGLIHEFTNGGEYTRSFEARGRWCKFMALSPDRSVVAVSNWLSDTVSLLSARGELLRTIAVPGARTPRGIAFEPDGSHLVVTWFGSGEISRHRVADGVLRARYSPGGAMRHVVIDPTGGVAYVTNMARREVVALELPNLRLKGSIRVDSNPNTIVLSAEGEHLYVSCRGPNHPDGYTLRSPRPGTIHVIETATMETAQVIPAGTQPTGLALSPNERLLASTSFQDDEVLVWALVDGLVEGLAEKTAEP